MIRDDICLYLLLGKPPPPHFPDSSRLVCELTSGNVCICWGQLCARGACQDHASHASSPAALPHSGLRCNLMKAPPGPPSIRQVPSRIRCVINLKHLTRARSDCHMLKLMSLFWMDGWMGLSLCAKWSCDHIWHTLHGQTFGDSLWKYLPFCHRI